MIQKVRRIVVLVAFNVFLTVFLIEVMLRLAPLPAGFKAYLKATGMLQEQENAYV